MHEGRLPEQNQDFVRSEEADTKGMINSAYHAAEDRFLKHQNQV